CADLCLEIFLFIAFVAVVILGPGAIATAAAGAAAGCALGAAAGTAAGVTIGGISSAIGTLYRSRKK
ncbi:unnamed protein product, partial [Rotaria sp. Silwood1]